jgi:predicted ATPase/DNA-binding CsgD family transcriptional regulator
MPRTDPASGSLPAELTSFVGRRRELAEIKRLLGVSRLVTLTGVGGTGKTRLAGRAAGELRRAFPDGSWFVDLTALRAPGLLVLKVQDPQVLAYLMMGALGLREQPGAGSPTEQLVRYLARRRALLVVDNCEHLLAMSATLTDTLLRGCPRLSILATSREALLLDGETLFAVPPLPVPGPGAGAGPGEEERFEAVVLIAARARAVEPGFVLTAENASVVAELCRRLDGLPLAIELAAARVRVLAPEQLLARLTERFALLSRGCRTVPERQQTLRGCVDWSFELCAEPERLLWARLAVFVGGCELDAIEGICADELLPAAELLGTVAGLVDKSILLRDDQGGRTARYRMLETLRDYGQDKLVEVGEQERLRRRHRDWHTDLARQAEADWISPRQADWFARLDRELPNLRAAMEYSLSDPDGAEAALTTATGVYLYWIARGLHGEGRFWLDRALARPTDPTLTRIKALFGSAALASTQGDLPMGITRARQGHELAAQLGDARAHAIAAGIDGVVAPACGELAHALDCLQRAVDGMAAEPAPEFLAWRLRALVGVAMVKAMLGDVDGAVAAHEAVLALSQPRGESWFSGFALWTLGLGLFKRGDRAAAAARLCDGLQHLRKVNDAYATGWCLDALAWIACDEGRPERAATLLGAVIRLAQAMGARPAVYPELSADHERYAQRTRAALGERAYAAAFARGQGLSLDEAVAYALDEPAPPAAPGPMAASTPLTRREQQVAELVAQGLSNKEVAARLVIAQRTAESHVDHILTKLGLTNRTQAAAWMAAQPSSTAQPPETPAEGPGGPGDWC